MGCLGGLWLFSRYGASELALWLFGGSCQGRWRPCQACCSTLAKLSGGIMQPKICVGTKRGLQIEGLCVRVSWWDLGQLSMQHMVFRVLPR